MAFDLGLLALGLILGVVGYGSLHAALTWLWRPKGRVR
jgi:hypothetical protein